MNKKQSFSIGSRYLDVIQILNSENNKSDFICNAILFYHHKRENTKRQTEKEDIKKIVLEVLSEINVSQQFIKEPIPSTPKASVKEDTEDDGIDDEVLGDWFDD